MVINNVIFMTGTAGPKGIAKRAVKDTAKVAIGVDPAAAEKKQ